MGQQRGDQLLLAGPAGLGLKNQAHCGVLAGLVPNHIQHGQHGLLELNLVLAQRFFAGLDLRIGDVFDFLQDPLRADTGRQLLHHQLPLATRQVLDLPAGAHLERATARGVSRCDLGRAGDDLAAARVIRPGHDRVQLVVRQLGGFDQRHTGVCDLPQVVAWDLCGQTDRNAAGTIEERERQPRGQLAWLFGRPVVVGHKVHGAVVDLVHQQAGDAGQSGLGVTHGGRAVAVPASKVALPIDQRVTL